MLPKVQFNLLSRPHYEIPHHLPIVPLPRNIHFLPMQIKLLQRRRAQIRVIGVISAPAIPILAAISHNKVQSGSCVVVRDPLAVLAEWMVRQSGVYPRAVSTDRYFDPAAAARAVSEGAHFTAVLDGAGEIGGVVVWGFLHVQGEEMVGPEQRLGDAATAVGGSTAIEMGCHCCVQAQAAYRKSKKQWNLQHYLVILFVMDMHQKDRKLNQRDLLSCSKE